MNSKQYWFLLAVTFLGVASACSAQQKNILFVRFEQKHFKQSELPADAFFSVFYRLQCPNPSSFRGFDARMVFETTKIAVVPKNSAKAIFADGSVSEGSDISSYIDGELRVLVDASQMFDTTNHLLFQFRTIVKASLADSALVIPTRFDALDGIDTVIIENAPGRDEVAWYQFAIAYLDSDVVIPPQKRDITISSDSLTIMSDSTAEAIVKLGNVDSAKIATGVFSSDIDTSIITVDTVYAVDSAMMITPVIAGTALQVQFSSMLTLQSGPILRIALHAKPRTDTIRTILLNPRFVISNTDNLVGSKVYDFDSITVYGEAQKDTTSSVVLAKPDFNDTDLRYQFGRLWITSESDLSSIRIFSQTGALVYASDLKRREPVSVSLSSGVYVAEVVGTNRHTARLPFIVVH
ncbi:MAG TPA: hypothetical protein VFO76_08525 [Candidatus Kapabacteria bacterium]|nr:hypothetical protein [Candidatus Kapabacteria bacterium]